MATYDGDSGVVLSGANAIGEVKAFSYSEESEFYEDSAMGDTARTFKAGKAAASGQITCHMDWDDTNGQETLTAGTTGLTLVLRPEGTGSGNVEYTATSTARVVSVESSQSFGDGIIERVFNFAVDGVFTKGTQA